MNSGNFQDTKSTYNQMKSVAFQKTNNELFKKEMKKTFPLTIASKRIKYLEINLTKKVEGYTLKTVRQ